VPHWIKLHWLHVSDKRIVHPVLLCRLHKLQLHNTYSSAPSLPSLLPLNLLLEISLVPLFAHCMFTLHSRTACHHQLHLHASRRRTVVLWQHIQHHVLCVVLRQKHSTGPVSPTQCNVAHMLPVHHFQCTKHWLLPLDRAFRMLHYTRQFYSHLFSLILLRFFFVYSLRQHNTMQCSPIQFKAWQSTHT
jgi:hypothetical protein